MNGGIFLIQSDGLVEMKEQPFDNEDILQELLAKYPNLLAGDQIDDAAPRRWILVSREMGVPCEDDGADRWSLDHLFLDQDAIPTLVEVKRSTDTRLRREVFGQILDYAANAVVYWPIEEIRAQLEKTCQERGSDVSQELQILIGQGANEEEFWQRAKTNLKAGRIRMVLVADVIPAEVRRIVEFLNGQMDPAEVLAVELRQYVGQGLRTLVPRVFGKTAEAEGAKTIRLPKTKWDESRFMDALTQRRNSSEANAAREILVWAKKNASRIWWGEGSKDGSFFPMFDHNGQPNWIIGVWSGGTIEMPFQHLRKSKPFDEENRRIEYVNLLNKIPGVQISPDAIGRRPSVPLSALTTPDTMSQFLKTLEWYLEQIKSA